MAAFDEAERSDVHSYPVKPLGVFYNVDWDWFAVLLRLIDLAMVG
jgi:hypothetical protein